MKRRPLRATLTATLFPYTTLFVSVEIVSFALSLNQGEADTQGTNELAARGYRWAYRILNTREFGLPHRRRRIFICGMLDGDPGGALFHGIDRAPELHPDPTHIGFNWTEGNRGVGWTARKSVVWGKGVTVRVDPCGRRLNKIKETIYRST